MGKRNKRIRIPSRVSRRYLGLLKTIGGEMLAAQGSAVLSTVVRGRKLPFLPPDKPAGTIERVDCVGRCRQLGGDRAIAECVAGCLGVCSGRPKSAKPAR